MSFRYTMIGAAVCIFIFYLGLIPPYFILSAGRDSGKHCPTLTLYFLSD
ncbi:MAG: hypothetical protein ACXU9M_14220 [Thermodesulfobacteriota bacterium]